MLTLVHAPRSRSSGFVWMLEELGQPYTIERVSIRRGDGSGSRGALRDPRTRGRKQRMGS